MNNGVREFLDEKVESLTERAEDLRKAPVAAARRAAIRSAERIRSLNERVRRFARSGVRLTTISQGTAQGLIELQAEIVTSALTDAATQLQRAAHTKDVRDLVRDQAEVLQAARERIVDDMSRAVKLLKGAAGDVRKVAQQATAEPAPRKRPVRRAKAKAKAKTRKTARRTRK